jgi:hypothetical protein
MKKSGLVALAALCASVAIPALAQPRPGPYDGYSGYGSRDYGGYGSRNYSAPGPRDYGPRDYRGTGDRYVNEPLDPSGWITVGREVFGPNTQEATVLGDGRPASSIGIRPVNGDARCRYVTATFADGSSRRLPGFNLDQRLDEGQVHNVDLGGYQEVMRIDMACQSADGRRVELLVMAR